jgi:DtxR family Mn-dependent transcriptional regulator
VSASNAVSTPREELSRTVEDYLKAIYKLGQADAAVSTSALADELDRSAASVTNMMKSLAEQGLVEHTPYRGVRLTARGELTALRVIRRHRVLELYLIEKLGYTWDGVHEEAERLEHAASDRLIDRMAHALGEPTLDPHGSPIPTREGEIAERDLISLGELRAGEAAVIQEVPDHDEELLRRVAALGLYPQTRIVVRGRRTGDGSLTVEVAEVAKVLHRGLASVIMVERIPAGD